jgi:hypothetical protein
VSTDRRWRTAVRAAVTPLPVPWAVAAGLRAAVAAGAVLAASLAVGNLRVGGIAYLGVACAVSSVGRGDYRSRAVLVVAQAAGACAGMTVGVLVPGTPAAVVAASAVVGALAGAVGRIGPASTAARHRLAVASTAAREAVAGYRVRPVTVPSSTPGPPPGTPRRGRRGSPWSAHGRPARRPS